MNLISGPKTPPGFSGIRPWVLRALVGILLALGIVVIFVTLNQKAINPASADPVLGRHVRSADAQTLTVTARETVPPPPAPLPSPQQVALADLGQQPPQQPAAPQENGNSGAVAPVDPPSLSPSQIARVERAKEDHAARSAPWGSVVDRVKDAIDTPAQAVASKIRQATDYDVAPPPDPFLAPGTIIDVTLYTSIDSTFPGTVIGYIGRDVLDFRQRVKVIPTGAKIIGRMVTTALEPGQSRIGVVWDGIILPPPSGHEIVLDGASGIDLTGTAGFGAKIDTKMRKQITSVIAYSVLAAGLQLAQPQGNTGCSTSGCSPTVGQSIGQAVGSQIASAGTSAYGHNGQITPTAHVVEGASVGVMVSGYIPMREWRQEP